MSERQHALLSGFALVGAVAWGLSTGGTSAVDLVVIAVLLSPAAFVARSRVAGAHGAVLLTLLGSIAFVATVHDGLTLDSLRVPVQITLAVAAYRLATRLGADDRERVLDAFILLGIAHATVALAESTVAVARDTPVDAAGLLGSPNALAAYLAATVMLTLRRPGRRGAVWVVALTAQLVAVAATGSRLAMALVVLAVGVHQLTDRHRLRWAALVGTAAAALLVATRMIGEPFARSDLWTAASQRVWDAPWFGTGVQRGWLVEPGPGVPGTPYAHNEPLQLAMEYGVPVALLAVGALTWALWPAVRSRHDPWLLAAACTLVASGLIDVTMRSTPVLVATATLVGFAATSARRAEAVDVTAERRSARPHHRGQVAASSAAIRSRT